MPKSTITTPSYQDEAKPDITPNLVTPLATPSVSENLLHDPQLSPLLQAPE